MGRNADTQLYSDVQGILSSIQSSKVPGQGVFYFPFNKLFQLAYTLIWRID